MKTSLVYSIGSIDKLNNMTLKEKILQSDYKHLSSKDQFKAKILNLYILLAIMIMLVDVAGSIQEGYIAMSIIEGVSAVIYILTYSLSYHTISFQNSKYIVLSVITLLFTSALSIPSENPQLAFFWISTLPIYLFFFLGTYQGLRWTFVVIVLLLITVLNSYFEWIKPLYSVDLLSQITLGYAAISYLLYILEGKRKRYEENLDKANKDKEALIKIIHHRTKNNMQVMIGLLDMQSLRVEEPHCKQLFYSHVDRLKTMSILHEHLYNGIDYETIDMSYLLKDVINNIKKSLSVTITHNLSSVRLSMRDATNLSLILNEALTNALNHAYPNREEGIIEINLKNREEKHQLIIKDEGCGYDTQKSYRTLGLSLINSLVSSLQNSTLDITSTIDHGTTITITFTGIE